MAPMKDLFSPASLITMAGGALAVIGAVAYTNGNANLSLPTIFYGIPILLGGLALKSSELPPAKRVTPAELLRQARQQGAPELGKLVWDVTRWRYGQKAHLETSLEALKLWDKDNPPQLLEIEELETAAGYGMRLRFELGAVPLDRWQECQERLGRFFAKGLHAELKSPQAGELDLILLPVDKDPQPTGQHGVS